MNNYLIFDSKLIQYKMKHLLSIFAALLFITNIANAQTVNSEIRVIGGKKYLIYNIKAGETWASIAEKSGITERSLIDANEQANGSLKNVATLKVPIKKSTKNVLNKNTLNNQNSIQIEPENALIDTALNNNKIIKPIEDKTVIALTKTKELKTNKSKAVKKYYLGNPLTEKTTVLEDNAIKTTDGLTDELNAKELNESNSNVGKTKDGLTHIVLVGETIEFVAKKYKISISDIANWNNLTQKKIRVGQELIVKLNGAYKPYLLSNSMSAESNKQIKNTDKLASIKFVEEKGLCFQSEENFMGIAHRNAPIGTLLLLTSTENYKEIYVRVTSVLVNSNVDVILQVDKKTAEELAFNSSLINVLISYSKFE